MIQQRIKKDFKLIKLPTVFNEEDRGLKECCDPEIVLASDTNDSWKNDITPAWIKLNDAADSATFTLKKNGQAALFQPQVNEFPNDLYSLYIEVEWKDVLASDGPGCYSIEIDYSTNGTNGTLYWGKYQLLPFTPETSKGTARLRAVFNHFQEIEGINFKGANVNGTIRFNGFIGNRQPNKEINTLTYSNREVKNVVVENLNTYELSTDPLNYKQTTTIIDLYFLSEVEMYASDHNVFNHSYAILDIPVILKETEEVEYGEYYRGAVIKAKLSDKFNNERTFYI